MLLFSENTIKDVNNRVNNTSVGVRNFRPNILVSGVEAYDEVRYQICRNLYYYHCSKLPED